MPGTGPLRRSSELARKKAIVGKSKKAAGDPKLNNLSVGICLCEPGGENCGRYCSDLSDLKSCLKNLLRFSHGAQLIEIATKLSPIARETGSTSKESF
jgi:hypothetical protein